MEYGEIDSCTGDWLKITYIENPYMAFGIDIAGKLFLVVFSFLAAIGIFIFLYRNRQAAFPLRLSLALILAGAIGNLLDRTFYGLMNDAPLFYGNVVDFINLDLFTIQFSSSSFKFWPIFNIADAAVSVGVVVLLIVGIPREEKERATETTSNPPVKTPGSDDSAHD
jgi:signal peptidase II